MKATTLLSHRVLPGRSQEPVMGDTKSGKGKDGRIGRVVPRPHSYYSTTTTVWFNVGAAEGQTRFSPAVT